MFTLRYHAPGTAPATLVSKPAAPGAKPVVTLIEYDRTSYDEQKIERVEELYHCTADSKVHWINVDGLWDPELLRAIGKHFGLHPLTLEDVQNLHQRPKLEEYPDHYFIVTQMLFCEEDKDICFEQVSIFLGRNFLITFQEEGTRDVFNAVRHRLRQGRGFARSMGHDYLAYALLDAVIDHYFPALEALGEAIEEMEDELLEHPTRKCVTKLHDLKRMLLHLRRAAWPEREVLSALTRDETGLVTHDTKIFLRDCYDHTIQIMDVIESYRDLTSGMMDLYLSSLGMRTNEIMRVLTVVTTIFIPLTFVAGIYGMNFDTGASPYNMPELKHPYGYVICLTVMAVIAVTMVVIFRKKRWL